jgi:hypothetical protein
MNYPVTFKRKLLRLALGVLLMWCVFFLIGFMIAYFVVSPFQISDGICGGLLLIIVSLASGPFYIKWWKKS